MSRARVAATACALTVLLAPAVVRAQIVPWPAQTAAPDSGSAAWQRFHAFHQPATNDVVTPPPPVPPPPSAPPRSAPPSPTPAPAAPPRTSAPRLHAQRPLPVPVGTPSPAPIAARPTPAGTPRPQPAVATRHVVHTIHFGDATPERSPPVWYGWGTL